MERGSIKPESLFRNVTGVILAGGRSRRMGKDKTMLEIGGITLFDRALQMMRELFSDILIAGDREDLVRPGVPCHADLFPGSALGGLYTGLLRSKHDMIFVCSCDMPSPNVHIARIIVSQDPAFDVVVPRTPDGLEPLFARYSKTCLPAMKDMLDRQQFRIYDFYPKINTRYIEATELPGNWHTSFLNVNTPEEYNRVKEGNW